MDELIAALYLGRKSDEIAAEVIERTLSTPNSNAASPASATETTVLPPPSA
ncbi:MAG: hypothetical protein ACLUSP_11995 [Christensenellales bacterium]